MITIIIIIIVIVLGKFIYDSYLTNNTEERWEEYKKIDPDNARRIDTSKFGAKTDYKNKADKAQQKKS